MESDKFDSIIEEISEFSVPKGKSKEKAWQELHAKISPKAKSKFMWTKVQMGIAASLLLLIAIYPLLRTFSDTNVLTKNSQHLVYYLPDSSKVTLNADSKITFNKQSWESNRVVNLEGEAFFEVKEGSNFEVISNKGSVAVLGTSFNIYARKDSYNVACLTGKVKVSAKKNKAYQILTPGLHTYIINDQVSVPRKLTRERKLYSWIDNEFYFEEVSITSVINEIERQYDITIKIPKKMEKRTYTGYFDNKNIKNTLDKVCLPMGLKYDIVDKRVVIVSLQ